MIGLLDQFDPDKVGELPSPAPAPVRQPRNPAGLLSKSDPYPDEEVTGLSSSLEQKGTSATGAFVRGAARGAAPAIGSLPAIGVGAEAGAAFGALFGPAAPVTVPLGALIGGGAAGLGAGYAISKAQDWALSKLPDSWTEKIGMSERQRELDEKHHGTAAFLGGLAPYALTMRPGATPKAALPDNATTLQRVMANPVTARVFGGGVMGGIELGQEAAAGDVQWPHVAIATGFGVVFNRPTRIGEALIGAGSRPMLRLVGKEAPVVPGGPAATEPSAASPEAASAPSPEIAAPAQAAGPPVTAADWRTEITERTRTGRPYELPPRSVTVADAADLGVMGPGITEETFHGSHQRSEAAEQTSRETKQLENSIIGAPPVSDVHSVARQMHLDLFNRYDALRAQEAEFSRWSAEERESPQAQQHLAAVREELAKVQPEVAAAYRRAAEHAGTETVESESASAGRLKPGPATWANKDVDLPVEIMDEAPSIGPDGRSYQKVKYEGKDSYVPLDEIKGAEKAAPALPARTIEEQREFIRGDVARQLERAGRPKEEAEAAGALIAARYETRAAQFKGARGTAEELYHEEGAEILGPGARAQQPVVRPPSQPRVVNEEKLSLLQFLAHKGGLKRTADLEATLGKDPFVAGFGRLFREGGMTEDRAREAASEAGYLLENQERTGNKASIRDLHDAINDESRGRKRYRQGYEPPVEAFDADHEEYLREQELLQRQRPTEPSAIHEIPGFHFGPDFLSPNELYQIKAYHGSPHDFDRFDLSKIGTGEARLDPNLPVSQRQVGAYGPGLYFAENEGVAASYEQQLRPVTAAMSTARDGDKFSVHVAGKKVATFDTQAEASAHRDMLWEEQEKAAPPGHVYQVAINAEPEHFLDWDKPLSEQSEHVRKTLGVDKLPQKPTPEEWRAASDLAEQRRVPLRDLPEYQELDRRLAATTSRQTWADGLGISRTHIPAQPEKLTGSDFLQILQQDMGGEGATNKLHSAGIPGIKYLDAGSRFPKNEFGSLTKEEHEVLDHIGWGRAPDVTAIEEKQNPASAWEKNFRHWREFAGDGTDRARILDKLIANKDFVPTTAKGTSNYVIFDDKLIDITHKDGTPVTGKDRDDIVKELLQPARGKINLNPQGTPGRNFLGVEDVRPIVRIFAEGNASTIIHEVLGHQGLAELMRDAEHPLAPDQLKADAQTTLKWLGVEKAEDIGRRQHEKFATGFEQYLREGVAPSPGLARVFAQFKQWLLKIYETIKGLGAPISEDIRGVFDRMLAEEPQRTVIAPEREAAKSQADIHEVDARETEPAHADAGQARIDQERDARYVGVPHDIRTEFEADDARHEPTVEPGGAPSEGAGGPGTVQSAGGVTEPVASGGGGGEGAGPQREGVAGSGSKSSGLPGQRPASEGPGGERAHLGDLPLAPHGAADFAGRDTFNLGKDGNIRTENITSVEQFAREIEEAKDRIPGTDAVFTDGMLRDARDEWGLSADVSLEDLRGALERAFGGVKDLNKKVAVFRQAVRDQSEKVYDLMARVRAQDDTASILDYAREREKFDMMMSVLSSVSTEWGRAGRAFRNLEEWDMARAMNDAERAHFVKGRTGRELYQLRMEAKLGSQLDSPAKVARFLRDAQHRSFGGMLLEYFINNLISGPATHSTYYVANKITRQLETVFETPLAAMIGATREALGRPGERVYLGEALAREQAIFTSIPKRYQAAIEAIRTGQPTLLPGQTARPVMPFFGDSQLNLAKNITNDPVTYHEVMGDLFASLKGVRDGIVSGAALVAAGGHAGAPIIGAHWTPGGQIPDVAFRGVPVLPVGSLVRIPGRAIAAIHSMDTATNYSAAIAARAYREAIQQGLDGNARASHIANRTQNPPQDWMEAAHKEAYAATLMAPGGNFVHRLSQLLNTSAKLPGIGEIRPLKFIDPFVHIGANVITKSIVERTPLGILSSELRADLMGRNGNIAQDTAQARMLAGTALAITFGSLAMEGYITGSGPSDPKEAMRWRQVYQPHSVRIGDIWYQVNRLGPLGMLLSTSADLYSVARDASEGEMLTAAAHLQHAITQNILDESFMRGPSDLIKAVEDPGRYGEGYLKNFASSFVPFSTGMFQIARAADPYSRQARTVVDAIKQRIPGISETLLPRRDIWGEEIPNPEAFGHAGFTAIYMKKVNTDPVNQAMLDLGIAPALVERKIRNVDLTDEEYDDFARLAGRMAKQRLDVIVKSPDWQTWPNHVKHTVLQEVIGKTREAARGLMMMKFPHIPQDAAADLRERKTSDEMDTIH
jgi:hypothetical protein